MKTREEILESIGFSIECGCGPQVTYQYFHNTDVVRVLGEPVKRIEDQTTLFYKLKLPPTDFYSKDGLHAFAKTDNDMVNETLFTDRVLAEHLAMNEGFGQYGVSKLLYDGFVAIKRPLQDLEGFTALVEDEIQAYIKGHDFAFTMETNSMQRFEPDIVGMRRLFQNGNLAYFSRSGEQLLFYERID